MPYHGDMLCCYPSIAAGENVLKYGFPSPSDRPIGIGEPIFMSFSLWGANACRFGYVAADKNDLPPTIADYADKVAAPYFAALAAWYQTLRVGTTGNQLHHAVIQRLAPHGLRVGLNIGHQIAADEWTSSLVSHHSKIKVRSGMYFQADFFATAATPHYGAFAEDGLAIADRQTRKQLAARYPIMCQRIALRRTFMRHHLGIHLHQDLLPFSNFQGAVIPHFLSPSRCMTLPK
jgi:hypothetical protein